MARSVVVAKPAAAPSAASVSATDSPAWNPAAARTARTPSRASTSPQCRPVRSTTSSSTGLSPKLRSTQRWSYHAGASCCLSAYCSRPTTAITALRATGTRSARTTLFRTLAPGTVPIAASAGTGANGTATGSGCAWDHAPLWHEVPRSDVTGVCCPTQFQR
jgi:hypothetical protein